MKPTGRHGGFVEEGTLTVTQIVAKQFCTWKMLVAFRTVERVESSGKLEHLDVD